MDVTVTIEGKPCRILDTSALISAFTCTVPVNSDGTAQITAGNPATVVTINSLGIIPLADGVAPITVPLVLSTVSPAAGADNGGYFATLTGNGFPTDATKITVSVCNSIASISSISNQQIVVFMPSCDTDGETSLTVTYNNLPPQTVTFTYQVAAAPPTITAVSPASSNPTWKTTLTITGTSFGSDIAVCKVFLANATGKVYPLKVLSLSDTTIRAGLSGGYPGNYIVQVTIGTIGDAVVGSVGANSFSYSIIVSSVTPQTGSNYGGTLITLTGTNFLPDTTLTTVYIGDDHNQFCRIETITSTTITCRTPKISPLYQADTVLPVYTSSRLIVDSTCDTSSVCHFTYATAAASPALLTISATSAGSAANVTVTGTLLASGASTCTIVLTNLITQAITPVRAQACNDTVATFSVPNVEAGSYSVKVRTDPKG